MMLVAAPVSRLRNFAGRLVAVASVVLSDETDEASSPEARPTQTQARMGAIQGCVRECFDGQLNPSDPAAG